MQRGCMQRGARVAARSCSVNIKSLAAASHETAFHAASLLSGVGVGVVVTVGDEGTMHENVSV